MAELTSYHPVADLPFVAKLLERIVLEQIQLHFGSLSAARPLSVSIPEVPWNRDCAELSVQNDIFSTVDKGNCIALVLSDIHVSAAIDTIDHDRLLNTLYVRAGIRGVALEWIRDYLSRRSPRVEIDQTYPNPMLLPLGVAQGSVLGPTLFTV